MIGAAVMILGWGVVLVGTIMFLIAAFKESPVWGIACLICGPAALLFIVLHFRAMPSPAFLSAWSATP
jgi:hypothetical protein